ncbi:hypothetical protein ACP70R_010547 [Stipagrostis hirtigluma subsp. patula]
MARSSAHVALFCAIAMFFLLPGVYTARLCEYIFELCVVHGVGDRDVLRELVHGAGCLLRLRRRTGWVTLGKATSFCGIGCDDVRGALVRRHFEEAMRHEPDAACAPIVKSFLCEKCIKSPRTQPFNLTADLPAGSSLPDLLCRSPPAASSSSVNHPNRKGSQSPSDGENWVLIAMGTALVLAIAICVAIMLLNNNGDRPMVNFGNWFSGNNCFNWGNRAGDAASAAAASEEGTELDTV